MFILSKYIFKIIIYQFIKLKKKLKFKTTLFFLSIGTV